MSRLDELKKEVMELEAKAGQQQEQPVVVREWDSIPDNDAAVLSLMERVEGQEYLLYWPEYANRSLKEAKEVVYLRQVSGDTTKSTTLRAEAENALMAIRQKLRGDK